MTREMNVMRRRRAWQQLVWWVGLAWLVSGMVGCASVRVSVTGAGTAPLLADSHFLPARSVPTPEQVLAINEPMRAYLHQRLRGASRHQTLQERLLDALYTRTELQLDYDARITRTAAEAFADRRGNCLSLVLMTAAFAQELGIRVAYNETLAAEPWQDEGDLVLHSNHVNLTLADPIWSPSRGQALALTVDFVPGQDLRNLAMRRIELPRVLAMFYNNRAAESLLDGELAQAYWFVRAALQQDDSFDAAHNTLGVVYQRAGHLVLAAQVFEDLLARLPDAPATLANLAMVRQAQGLVAEADALRERLARQESVFGLAATGSPGRASDLLDRGRAALARGELVKARRIIETDGRQRGISHEQQFWLAQVLYRMGLAAESETALRRAHAASPPEQQARYAGKLAWLRAQAHLQ